MGSCTSKSGNSSAKVSNNNVNVSALNADEQPYVKGTPSWLYKDGQTFVALSNGGKYRYLVGFDKTEYKVDTNSAEYKKHCLISMLKHNTIRTVL